MTINFYHAGNADGLFNLLGKAFLAQSTCNTARGTTIPDAIDAVSTIFNNLTVTTELEAIIAQLGPQANAARSQLGGQVSALQSFCQSLLIQMVNDDSPQSDKTLATALRELIRQMIAEGESVDASGVSAGASTGSANVGDGVFLASTKRGDGLVQENMLAETVNCEVTTAGASATILCTGQAAADSLLSSRWPLGSGVRRSITSVAASGSLLTNGDFEDEDDLANCPDDWQPYVATIGTTLKMTDVEVQTIQMTGTHTGGVFYVRWTDPDGNLWETIPLAYNAGASTIQSALRTFDGLAAITVTATGTSPDETFTVTFTGFGGNVAQFTSVDLRTGGSGGINHATTSAGSANVYAGGKAVEFDSNGSQLTQLRQDVTANLSESTAYAVSGWMLSDVIPAGGKITVDLVDGAGTLIRDDQGMQQSFYVDCTDLLTTWQHLEDLVAAVDEVQTLTITGTPDGGDFTLTFDGQTTGAIAYNADAATVQAALIALSNLVTGDVVCGGGGLPGTPVTITFGGAYAGRSVPLITADGSGLTGGTTPDAAVALTTPGSAGEAVLRTPAVLPDVVYFRIHISTAVSSGTSVFLDHFALAAMTELYPGGPLVAAFSGAVPFKVEDEFTLSTTNNRAGLLQEFAHRNFGMASLGLLLPSNAAAAESVPDSVVG